MDWGIASYLDTSKPAVVTILLYAAVLTLLVSRELLDLVKYQFIIEA
ncbi:MAG TPA: hypothetical protein VFJ06_07105 [Halococcus sp.]|nr:hypothetical protein [Halococcus sp.]